MEKNGKNGTDAQPWHFLMTFLFPYGNFTTSAHLNLVR